MGTELKPRESPLIQRRPTMLKDFLRDDLSSCSSSGFRFFPRRTCYSSVRSLLEKDVKGIDSKNCKKLLRNRSKAGSTASAFEKASEMVTNVTKHFQFMSVKSSFSTKQWILARNLSRRLKRSFTKRSNKEKREITVVVKVKDIIRWRSFRDLIEEKQRPAIDFSESPPHHATTTTTASHSWSDSDFTSDYLHSSSSSSDYYGENEADDRKKDLPEKTKEMGKRRVKELGEDSIEKGQCKYEKDQFSPVSVHDFPFDEDEETPSSIQPSLDKMERTKQNLMRKIRRFGSLYQLEPVNLENRIASFELDDSVECPSDSFSINDTEVDEEIITCEEEDDESIRAEEKARNLLKLLRQTSSEGGCETPTNDLLLDFFRERFKEQNVTKQTHEKGTGDGEAEKELMREATEWMNGQCGTQELGREESREMHIREMDKDVRWCKFEEEQGQLAMVVESVVFCSLMNELLLDLVSA